ncbi:protein-L-isoaspartate O-methyltransferase [Brevundimonas sp. Leaf363]|uniref:protein-L-isoaspartate O-methyltransferase family protein n=1 Tax=Brevundimonas sp. Leaf363 TaxID=1736353 RepID=UPI00070068F9|nr:protein-L-isoaspartate O-methyltransferase [Brevundimonas sp. Leaf363]KQS56161.1 protein-L-isoaspartate O-methyltransferase [Brevundimonas sp. Leaf363]
MDHAAARKVMVDSQVRVNDVTDRALQAALLDTPRERFCADDQAYAAYAEVAPVIAGDRRLMQAREIGKLLQACDAREGETALCIAAPYAAAVLARMGLSVTAQDTDAVFAVAGEGLDASNVTRAPGDLAQPIGQDWDLIVSECAVAVRPTAWLQALKVGGRLAVVERPGRVGKAVLYVRGQSGFSRKELFDAAPSLLAELTPAPTFAL